MKTTSHQQIFDNCFKWQYVGKCVQLFLFNTLIDLILLAFTLWGFPFIFSLIFHEEFMFTASLKCFVLLFTILFIGIDFLVYALISLPQMSTGTYRIDEDHLIVKEKLLGHILVDMYIPLSAITAVRLKKELRGRRKSYPYNILEIEASGTTYDLHCLAHQDELCNFLSDRIENNN